MPVTSAANLAARLTSPYDQSAGSNNLKLMQVFYDGYWVDNAATQAQMRLQSHLPTMSGVTIDLWAQAVNLPRATGESDGSYKLRIAARIQLLYGGVTVNSIISFVSALLAAPASDFTVVENYPSGTAGSGTFEPASYTLEFDTNILLSLGFTSSQFSTVIDSINTLLTSVSAAGVKASVFTPSGAVYDVDVFDTGLFGQ